MTTRRSLPTYRSTLIRRSREVPAGLWGAEVQFRMRTLIADLAHELANCVDEIRALRAVREER